MAVLACSQRGVRMRATSPAVSSGSGMGSPSGAWEAEHALSHDVALDLARAARDRPRERAQVLHDPGPLAPHRAAEDVGVDAVGAQRFAGRQQQALEGLAAVELE